MCIKGSFGSNAEPPSESAGDNQDPQWDFRLCGNRKQDRETDTDQHDIAIVYGEKTTYILCVMSENCKSGDAVSHIRDISGIVYNYLNMRLDQD